MFVTRNQFSIKRGPFSASRVLTIDPEYLELKGPLANLRFTKDNIEGFRYGVRTFQYLIIPISRTYNIEITNSERKIMVIRMHSFFGFGKKKIENLFIQIYNQIQEAYFNDMAVHYVQLLDSGLGYDLAGAILTSEGIHIRKDKPLIPWIRIGLMSYYRSCSIYDLADPQHFRSFDYWHDWNASLLYAVVDFKLKSTTYDYLKEIN
jgi:hypothetical protein